MVGCYQVSRVTHCYQIRIKKSYLHFVITYLSDSIATRKSTERKLCPIGRHVRAIQRDKCVS